MNLHHTQFDHPFSVYESDAHVPFSVFIGDEDKGGVLIEVVPPTNPANAREVDETGQPKWWKICATQHEKTRVVDTTYRDCVMGEVLAAVFEAGKSAAKAEMRELLEIE